MQRGRQSIRSRVKTLVNGYWHSFSFVGLVFATLFFAASVTPSLLPRNYLVQGLLSGFALAAGYGVGVAAVWVWQFLELRKPDELIERISKRVSVVCVAVLFVCFLRQMTFWQNSIRELMEMEAVATTYPYRTALIAVACGASLIAVVRLLVKSCSLLATRLNRFLPRRIANGLSAVIVGFLFLSLVNGVLARSLLKAADASFAQLDVYIDEGVEQPTSSTAS